MHICVGLLNSLRINVAYVDTRRVKRENKQARGGNAPGAGQPKDTTQIEMAPVVYFV